MKPFDLPVYLFCVAIAILLARMVSRDKESKALATSVVLAVAAVTLLILTLMTSMLLGGIF